MKRHFPAFSHPANRDSVYLDTASTSQICAPALRAVNEFYSAGNANAHRGVYPWSERATDLTYETKEKLGKWLNAPPGGDFVFCSGSTHALNLLAQTLCERFTEPGDKIALTLMEHHANLIPWQVQAKKRGLELAFVGLRPDGSLDWRNFDFDDPKLKILSVTQVSNVLGGLNPLGEILAEAKKRHLITVVDGAQSVPHFPVDLTALDPDCFVFSSHKMYAAGGLGCLYARRELLGNAGPYMTGGGMVRGVERTAATFADFPERFEPGTPNAAAAAALSAAIDFYREFDLLGARKKEAEILMAEALETLREIPGVVLLGRPDARSSLFSFTVRGVHPHDLAGYLGENGVMLRAGHHCAMPLMRALNVNACLRFSPGVYNDRNDLDRFAQTLRRAVRFFE